MLPAAGNAAFDPERTLVVAPANQLPPSSIERTLDRLLADGRPLVLYVHGRGDEPEKTARARILERIEDEHGVKVLMFNWDSRGRLLHRPVDSAGAAAARLAALIERIMTYRATHAPARAVSISLLAHSMGNIVLQKVVENGQRLTDASGPLFRNIVMTGSDADADGHRSWVEKLRVDGRILITINRNDLVLSWSLHENGNLPLGLTPQPPLARNAIYLDLTGWAGKAHRVFLKDERQGMPKTCEVISRMLRGEDPEWSPGFPPGGGDTVLIADATAGAGLRNVCSDLAHGVRAGE